MTIYPDYPKPLEEFKCNHCKSSSVEFIIQTTQQIKTDNFGNPVSMRPMKSIRKIICSNCEGMAVVVKLDPSRSILIEQNDSNNPITENEQVIREEKSRPKPISLSGDDFYEAKSLNNVEYKKWTGF